MAKGGRITEDEIKWILSVESTEAQQKIHQLTKENKELTKANKDRLSEMIKLEKQGKRDTEEYRNLSKVVEQNTARINKNNEVIKQLESRMKTSELTMSQLKKRAKDLQYQLDNTSKATHPEKWNQLDKELKDVHSRMNELHGSAKRVDGAFGGIKKMLPTIGWAAAIAWVTSLGKKSVDASLESEQALQRLKFAVLNVAGGSGSDIVKLKKQASSLMGIFDDEEIYAAETTMLNFGMSTEAVIELIPLMVDAAAASGKSLDEMALAVDKGTHSGVMARSALGQLGIVFKDTGNATKNYNLIVQGLSRFVEGNTDALKSNWGEVQSAKIQWGEFQETLGDVLSKGVIPLINGIANLNQLFKSHATKEAESNQRIAAGRLEDFKVRMNQQKDKVAFINTEIQTERNLYKTKQQQIKQNEELIKKDKAKGFFFESTNYQKQLEKENEGLQLSITRSIGFVNMLLGLRQQLKESGKKFNFMDLGDETDPLKEKTKELDAQALAEVVAAKQSAATQEELTTKLNEIQVKYLEKKRDLYQKDSAEYNDYQSQLLDISRAASTKKNSDIYKSLQDANKSAITSLDEYEQNEKRKYLNLLNEKKISKSEYDSSIIAIEIAVGERRVENAKRYADLINDTTFNSEEEKKAAVEAAKTALNAAEEALTQSLNKQSDKKLASEKDHLEKVARLRQELGLDKEKLSYAQGLEALKKKLKEAEASEKETADAINKYKLEKAIEYGQNASKLAETVSTAIQASQQAELDQIDAKYDVEIAAAKGNSDAVEKLEDEKEAKKLAVQKKYADSLFAVKVSQIIADTAVSIMKGYADLGPIGGSIAALALGVTAAAQLKSAKAERDKIKNLGAGSSGSSSGSIVASGLEDGGSLNVTRAQDGKVYRNATFSPRKRGYVDRPTVIVGDGPVPREWVASNAALQNPTIAPLIALLDKHQQAGTIRTLDLSQALRSEMIGLASGGSLSRSSGSAKGSLPKTASLSDMAIYQELIDLLRELADNGIDAYVVLSELEKKQALRDKSRKIGSK